MTANGDLDSIPFIQIYTSFHFEVYLVMDLYLPSMDAR